MSDMIGRSMRFAINGRFLTRRITGVDRFAREIVRELDKLLDFGYACIVVPKNEEIVAPLDLGSIELVRYGFCSGHAWEQIDFASFVKTNKLIGVNLCNTAPVGNPGIVDLHDMAIRAVPDFYSMKFRRAYRLLFSQITKRAKLIITGSQFSKNEILRFYPAAAGRIEIVPDAWQHVERVEADDEYVKRLKLDSGSYYLAMSSLAPNKNLKWIAETALRNPGDLFLVAGGVNGKVFGKHLIPDAPNMVYLGYVHDGQAKALLQGCKGFVFPTFYEGFGMPPMEALACGAQVAVSDTEIMHEIYGDSAHYVNPYIPYEGLGNLFDEDVDSAEKVLSRYSWNSSARVFLKLLESVDI